MKNFRLSTCLCVLILSSIGCASMFVSNVTDIPVNTTPEGAKVSVYRFAGEKIFENKTPCTISVNTKEALDAKVTISMKDYKKVDINLGRISERSAIWNAFLLPVIIITVGYDYSSDSLLKPEVETINIILEPEVPDDAPKATDENTFLFSPSISLNRKRTS